MVLVASMQILSAGYYLCKISCKSFRSKFLALQSSSYIDHSCVIIPGRGRVLLRDALIYNCIFFVVRAEVFQLNFIGVARLYMVSLSNFTHVVKNKILAGVIWVRLYHIPICIFNCILNIMAKAGLKFTVIFLISPP